MGVWNFPASQFVNGETVVRFHSINLEADTMATTRDFNCRVWVKDSAIIEENNWVMFDLAPTPQSLPAYLKTISFIYYNLAISGYQSYSGLSPEIKPEFNFKVSDSELFSSNYTGKNLDNNKAPLIDCPDTLLDNNIVKRKERVRTTPKLTVKDVFYFRKIKPDLVLHLNAAYDKKYYPYRAIKMESYVNGKLVYISEMELERNYLTGYERRIFKAWEKNLKSCKEFSSYLQFEKFCANKLETDTKIK